MENPGRMVWTDGHYRVGQKSDTSRTLHYIVREVSLFWPTLYIKYQSALRFTRLHFLWRP